jgi:hypothetical protein
LCLAHAYCSGDKGTNIQAQSRPLETASPAARQIAGNKKPRLQGRGFLVERFSQRLAFRQATSAWRVRSITACSGSALEY